MVMFNGAKRLLGTSNFQLKHANILNVRHFLSKYNTMSIHFLQKSCKNLARYFQELHFSQPRGLLQCIV